MKHWYVRANQKEIQCELVTAYVTTSNKLKLRGDGKAFMIQFDSREEYLEARDGEWIQVVAYTVNQEKAIDGWASFRETKPTTSNQ